MARLFDPFKQFFDGNGDPLASGTLEFFENGVYSNQLATYSDASLNNANPNPVTLNGEGRLPFDIFGDGVYSVELRSKSTPASPDGVLIDLLDTVGGDAGSRTAFSDWTSTIIYNIPAFVVGSDGLYYRSLSNSNLGNDPILNPGTNTWWEEFKLRGIWNDSITYGIGDVVQSTIGNLWKALTSQAANDPETDSGTNWIPAIDGAKVPEIIVLEAAVIAAEKDIAIPFTGGGVMLISELNELQDGNTGYLLPAADSVDVDEYMIISQPLEFASFEPVVTADGSDVITIEGGSDTSITFDQTISKDIRLTSNGVDEWRLTV